MPTTTSPTVAATYGIAESRTMVAEPRLLIDCTICGSQKADAVERNHDAEIGQRDHPQPERAERGAAASRSCAGVFGLFRVHLAHEPFAFVGAQPLRVGGLLGHVAEHDRHQQDRGQAFDQ